MGGGTKGIIMYEMKTWLIDDILNPNSDFWKVSSKLEIDNLLSRISPLQTDKLFRVPKPDPVMDKFSEFVDFFQSLSKEAAEEYIDFVEDNESDIMSDQVWRLVDKQDKRELFENDANKFDVWWSTLHHSEVEYYMTRLVENQRLIKPSEVLSFIKRLKVIEEKQHSPRNIKYYPLDAGKYLTVQMIGDKLAISSRDIKKLESVKELLISRGNFFIEERCKTSPHGDKIYTYLFLTKGV